MQREVPQTGERGRLDGLRLALQLVEVEEPRHAPERAAVVGAVVVVDQDQHLLGREVRVKRRSWSV